MVSRRASRLALALCNTTEQVFESQPDHILEFCVQLALPESSLGYPSANPAVVAKVEFNGVNQPCQCSTEPLLGWYRWRLVDIPRASRNSGTGTAPASRNVSFRWRHYG